MIKDKLREKLMPYKKMPRPEVPKTPLTPVEEMQKLQIRIGSNRGKSMEEQGMIYCLENILQASFTTIIPYVFSYTMG